MLHNSIEIILASQSPRRLQLLTDSGFKVITKPADIDETIPKHISNNEAAKYLAKEKAKAIDIQLNDNQCIIASDTIVILNEIIYGKPIDRDDAIHILSQLQNSVHEVITGVCIRTKDKEVIFDDTSKVWLNAMSHNEICYYIDTFKPYDKAGAYAIQEWIGYTKISKIEGTYTNIMGLPMDKVYANLHQLFTN
jgi:septum formation protein